MHIMFSTTSGTIRTGIYVNQFVGPNLVHAVLDLLDNPIGPLGSGFKSFSFLYTSETMPMGWVTSSQILHWKEGVPIDVLSGDILFLDPGFSKQAGQNPRLKHPWHDQATECRSEGYFQPHKAKEEMTSTHLE
ncbi:hypothetical protein BDV25DRAFT_135914 [Aspergillus avenaceus]|uniref:Uncharacterized protein n=1 Tax=Aspergillus avenaceus TaxID=36643 RepID=A0A5N6U7V0_ASPAV|nr:hypothetical protein BDV25DRAFT_135914 [Aspergillus avenaceus]